MKKIFIYQRTLRPELSEEMKRIKSLFAKFNIQCNIFCKYLRRSFKLVNSTSNQSSWPRIKKTKKNKSMSKTDVKLEKHQKSTRQF